MPRARRGRHRRRRGRVRSRPTRRGAPGPAPRRRVHRRTRAAVRHALWVRCECGAGGPDRLRCACPARRRARAPHVGACGTAPYARPRPTPRRRKLHHGFAPARLRPYVIVGAGVVGACLATPWCAEPNRCADWRARSWYPTAAAAAVDAPRRTPASQRCRARRSDSSCTSELGRDRAARRRTRRWWCGTPQQPDARDACASRRPRPASPTSAASSRTCAAAHFSSRGHCAGDADRRRARGHWIRRGRSASRADDGRRIARAGWSGRTAASRAGELCGTCRAGSTYGQSAVIGHLRPERPHQETAWQRFLPDGPLALLPLRVGG